MVVQCITILFYLKEINAMKDVSFYDISSYSALYQSAIKCMKCVTWKQSVQEFGMNIMQTCAELHKQLFDGTYHSPGFCEFDIIERGKKRHIQSVMISERTVQKSLCNNALRPLIEPLLIDDNYASRVGMGTAFAINKLIINLHNHYEKYGTNGGILLVDLHDYFHSIDHNILLEKLRDIIKDDRIFQLTEHFIDCFQEGLGLGSEISQTCAIFYPNNIDHFIVDELGISGYGRYMDDSYIIHNDVKFLNELKDLLSFLYADLHVELNQKKTHIVEFRNNDFEILKKRFRLTDDGQLIVRPVRKKTKMERRKLKKLKQKLDAGLISMDQIRQTYKSWRGSMTGYNCNRTLHSLDQLYMSLFNETYEGETIEDIKFRKNLYVMFRNNIDRKVVKQCFTEWMDKASFLKSKKPVIKKMKKIIRNLYKITWNNL